jgi:hypothetical protein
MFVSTVCNSKKGSEFLDLSEKKWAMNKIWAHTHVTLTWEVEAVGRNIFKKSWGNKTGAENEFLQLTCTLVLARGGQISTIER